MPLGQGIGEMWDAVRDRIEVSRDGSTWQVTGGSFDSALAYATERFGDPAVLARQDRERWWPRVTLTVTTDPAMAESAPALDDLARPRIPAPREPADDLVGDEVRADELPLALEEIFAGQEDRRTATAD